MSSIVSLKAHRSEVEALLDLGIDFCKPGPIVYVALYEMLFMISQVRVEFAMRSIASWRTT